MTEVASRDNMFYAKSSYQLSQEDTSTPILYRGYGISMSNTLSGKQAENHGVSCICWLGTPRRSTGTDSKLQGQEVGRKSNN